MVIRFYTIVGKEIVLILETDVNRVIVPNRDFYVVIGGVTFRVEDVIVDYDDQVVKIKLNECLL